jgi:hypothetical protein
MSSEPIIMASVKSIGTPASIMGSQLTAVADFSRILGVLWD